MEPGAMASDDRRKFGADLTNIVQNRNVKERLTKKTDVGNDIKGLKSSKKQISKPKIAKASTVRSKKHAETGHKRNFNAGRLAELSLNDSQPIPDKDLDQDFTISSKPNAELPYQKIRTYSKKPGKEWAYVENTKHVTFANEPLDIEAWLSKEKDNKIRNRKL